MLNTVKGVARSGGQHDLLDRFELLTVGLHRLHRYTTLAHFTRFNLTLGFSAAMKKAVRLIARFNDVAVMGESIERFSVVADQWLNRFRTHNLSNEDDLTNTVLFVLVMISFKY